MRTCLDLSSNDLATLDPRCWKAQGITSVICGVYDPVNPPHRMADAADLCRRSGLEIEAFYGLIYFGDEGAVMRDARWAIDLATQFGTELVFMDAEIDAHTAGWQNAPVPSPAQRNTELLEVRGEIIDAGLSPGLYTYRSWWQTEHADTKLFADLPLWFANYGANDGTQVPIETVNFGGWTTLWGHQFTSRWGAIHGCGRDSRDASYIFGEGADVGMSDKDVLAVFGSTENLPDGTPDWPTRLTNAQYRLAESAAGRSPSVRDLAIAAGLGTPSKPWPHKHSMTADTGGAVGLST